MSACGLEFRLLYLCTYPSYILRILSQATTDDSWLLVNDYSVRGSEVTNLDWDLDGSKEVSHIANPYLHSNIDGSGFPSFQLLSCEVELTTYAYSCSCL